MMYYSRIIPITMLLCALALSGCNLTGGAGDLPKPTPTLGIGGLNQSVATLPVSTPTVEAVKDSCANDYYPVVTGTTWTYTGNHSVAGPFSYTRTITSTSNEGFEDQDVWDSGLTRTGTWTCDQGDLTALSQGGVATVSLPVGQDTPELEVESVKSDGVSIPAEMNFNESWDQSINLTGKMTLLNDGMVVNVTNDTQITCTPTLDEVVSVPAGSFSARRVNCNSSMTVGIDNNPPGTVTGTSSVWYVAGVGVVKTVVEMEMGNVTIELSQYDIPVVNP